MPHLSKVLEPFAVATERFLRENNITVDKCWTRSNTFKWAFFDFSIEPRKGWVLGRGELQLSNLIHEQFGDSIIIFTHKTNVNVEKLKLARGDRPIIRISHPGFLQFYQRFGRKNAIRLFLLQIKTPEDEAYLRSLMLQNTEMIPDFLYNNPVLLDKVVGKLKSDDKIPAIHMNKDEIAEMLSSKEDFERLLQLQPAIGKNLVSIIVDVIQELPPSERNPEFLRNIPVMLKLYRRKADLESAVNELHRLVESKTDEREIHKHIFKNIWLLGDEYLPGDYIKSYEERLKSDEEGYYRTDIVLQRLDSHQDYVIVEFKRPEDRLTRMRGKMEIPVAKVTMAVSQALEYMVKTIEKKGVLVKAIVIVGGEEKPKWLKGYNYFLHGVRIITYEQIVTDARKRLKFYT